MPSSVVDIASHQFSPADRILPDANFWLFVYVPQGGRRWQVQAYSRALSVMLNKRAKLFVDVTILSEFVNRSAHWKWSFLRDGNPSVPGDFRIFCKSEHFGTVAPDVASEVRSVLKNATRLDSRLGSIDIASLLRDFERGGSSFNDCLIAEACRLDGMTLVTDDADFKSFDIRILTANRKLLS